MTLKGALEGDDEYLKLTTNKLWEKFQKYWSELSPILTIAAMLNPLYKLELVRILLFKSL